MMATGCCIACEWSSVASEKTNTVMVTKTAWLTGLKKFAALLQSAAADLARPAHAGLVILFMLFVTTPLYHRHEGTSDSRTSSGNGRRRRKIGRPSERQMGASDRYGGRRSKNERRPGDDSNSRYRHNSGRHRTRRSRKSRSDWRHGDSYTRR